MKKLIVTIEFIVEEEFFVSDGYVDLCKAIDDKSLAKDFQNLDKNITECNISYERPEV